MGHLAIYALRNLEEQHRAGARKRIQERVSVVSLFILPAPALASRVIACIITRSAPLARLVWLCERPIGVFPFFFCLYF